MVGDITEVTKLLSEAVKKQNNGNEQIESKNATKDIKSYHVDSVEMSKLNDAIQSYVESDQHDKEEGSNKNTEEKESECDQKCVNESISEIIKMRDSEEDSQSYVHPDESDFYGTSSSDEGSVESNFEDWCKRKTKFKEKHKRIQTSNYEKRIR